MHTLIKIVFFSMLLLCNVALAKPKFEKVITIVFENTNYSTALRAPYFKKLAQSGALFTDFYAQARPSQPNYFAMISGSVWNHYSNEAASINEKTIVDQLEANGRTWAAYAEDYPGNCYRERNHKTYARRHNPFMSFTNIVDNPERCSRITNIEQLYSDWAQNNLPNYSFVIPGNNSNGHDTSIEYASNWFDQNFSGFISNQEKMNDVLFIVTFDEAGLSLTNQVYTVLIGPSVKEGVKNYQTHTHYSLLKLIQDEWGLGSLGQGDSTAAEITGIWK